MVYFPFLSDPGRDATASNSVTTWRMQRYRFSRDGAQTAVTLSARNDNGFSFPRSASLYLLLKALRRLCSALEPVPTTTDSVIMARSWSGSEKEDATTDIKFAPAAERSSSIVEDVNAEFTPQGLQRKLKARHVQVSVSCIQTLRFLPFLALTFAL